MVLHCILSISLLIGGEPNPGLNKAGFNELYPILNEYVRDFPGEFRKIPEDRRFRLNEMVYFLEEQREHGAPWQITFISSDESTIGQMAKAWSKAAAHYFGFVDFQPYSGGLSPHEIAESTILALEEAGFIIYKSDVSGVAVYRLKYSYNLEPVLAFPKKVNHAKNPDNNFMAVILDRNADINLNNIKGTYNRLFLGYDDPLGYVGSDLEDTKFNESCKKIAVEMFYVFSQLHKRAKSN
jgi:arsenate reductase